jgi:tetratricopeptide (TPR) repeat protein
MSTFSESERYKKHKTASSISMLSFFIFLILVSSSVFSLKLIPKNFLFNIPNWILGVILFFVGLLIASMIRKKAGGEIDVTTESAVGLVTEKEKIIKKDGYTIKKLVDTAEQNLPKEKLVDFYTGIGNYLFNNSHPDVAVKYYEKAITLKESGEQGIAPLTDLYHKMAIAFYNIKEYAKCIESYEQELRFESDLNDTLRVEIYFSIASCKHSLGLRSESEKYLNQSEKLAKKIKNNEWMKRIEDCKIIMNKQ